MGVWSGSSCCAVCRGFLHAAMKTTSDKRATAELLAALVEVAIAHGRRHYSKSGEPLATTLAVPAARGAKLQVLCTERRTTAISP